MEPDDEFVEVHRILDGEEATDAPEPEDEGRTRRRLLLEAMAYMHTMGSALFEIIKDGGYQADRARIALMEVYGPDAFERWQAAEDKDLSR